MGEAVQPLPGLVHEVPIVGVPDEHPAQRDDSGVTLEQIDSRGIHKPKWVWQKSPRGGYQFIFNIQADVTTPNLI